MTPVFFGFWLSHDFGESKTIFDITYQISDKYEYFCQKKKKRGDRWGCYLKLVHQITLVFISQLGLSLVASAGLRLDSLKNPMGLDIFLLYPIA